MCAEESIWLFKHWTEIWNFVQAIASVAVVIVAWIQITQFRHEQKNQRQEQKDWETLKACEKYDTDPVLYEIVQKLRNIDTSGVKVDFLEDHTHEITILFNYFTGLCIGINQGFYNEKIIRAHLESIIKKYSIILENQEYRNAINLLDSDFSELLDTLKNWKQN